VRPSQAEASDSTNAVLDGCDGVVLTEETASGQYPIQSAMVMSKICVEAEKTINHKKIFNGLRA